MRILFVTNEIPYFTGGGMPIRDYNLLKWLSVDHQHEIVLLCFADSQLTNLSERMADLDDYCKQVVTVEREYRDDSRWRARVFQLGNVLHPMSRSVRGLSSNSMKKALGLLVRSQQFDVVHVNHIEMAHLLTNVKCSKRVVGIENVAPKVERLLQLQTRSRSRLAHSIEFRKIKEYERRLYSSVDLCTMASIIEQEKVLSISPSANVVVIPNGVDTTYFQPRNIYFSQNDAPKSLLFIGSMAYSPNEDAVNYFNQGIFPLITSQIPEVKWQVVGRDMSPTVVALSSRNIDIIGWVDDVRPVMSNSGALVVPLRSGGGTRLKILEAMAAGLPVISTSIGAEGLEVTDGTDILLADEPGDKFANAVLAVLQNPDLAHRLSQNGRRLVEV